jgi:CRP-like cAMP-binding protein
LTKGSLKITKKDQSASIDHQIAVMGSINLIGEESCFFSKPSSFSATVNSAEATILTLDNDTFLSLFKNQIPEMKKHSMKHIKLKRSLKKY